MILWKILQLKEGILMRKTPDSTSRDLAIAVLMLLIILMLFIFDVTIGIGHFKDSHTYIVEF